MDDTEGEIALTRQSQEDFASPYIGSVSVGGSDDWRGEVHLLPGLVQVRQEDGSLRNLPYTPETSRGGEVKFFYRGSIRSVRSVGGVASRVEGSQSEGAVTAPMNGQVVKLSAHIGDQVKCGDIVLILEAMKMENEVTAPVSGTVVDISVAPGQTVSPGQPMFRIEATE